MAKIYTGGLLLGAFLLLCGCATTNTAPTATVTQTGDVTTITPPAAENSFSSTGTPSPLNTSANPWTNVNPQIQGQMRQGQINAR